MAPGLRPLRPRTGVCISPLAPVPMPPMPVKLRSTRCSVSRAPCPIPLLRSGCFRTSRDVFSLTGASRGYPGSKWHGAGSKWHGARHRYAHSKAMSDDIPLSKKNTRSSRMVLPVINLWMEPSASMIHLIRTACPSAPHYSLSKPHQPTWKTLPSHGHAPPVEQRQKAQHTS